MKIVLTGAKHSGKTTCGKYLAQLSGIPFIDTDEYIFLLYKEKTGADKTVREIYLEYGEDKFRALEKEAVERIASIDAAVIATGGGVVLSEELRQLLFPGSIIVYLRGEESLLWKRIEENGLPPFYQGDEGRALHVSRVARIDEIMSPAASIIMNITEINQDTVCGELAEKIYDILQGRQFL
jgi:shikimate kinase